MPSPSPEGLLNRPLLRQLAGDKSFARGEEYFSTGHVRQLHVAGDRITARVSGSRTYRVKLWRGRGELHFSCTCAAGRDEAFCKHCVAVGLAWLAGPDGQPAADSSRPGEAAADPKAEKNPSRDQIQRHLRALDKDRLVNLVLEATDYDDILRRRLLLETIGVLPSSSTRRGAPNPAAAIPPDLDAYRRILREAIECPEYVDYDAMPDYAQGIEEAIYPLGELLRTGFAAAVIDLAEFALIELDKANEMVDGGDGSLNAVYDDLQHYHLEACRVASPDPVALAGRLLHYELEGGMGIFNNAVKAYADVLGPRGVAAWRQRLVREWSKLPALLPTRRHGGEAASKPINHRRFQIQALMERVAESEGDLATLAAVKERDLSSAHDFLSLAELHDGAGNAQEAMIWAERGLREFPELPDRVGLRDFVAAGYHRLQRHEDAVRLIWEEFARFGDLEHYRKLRSHAEQGDGNAWPDWRKKALTHLRQQLGSVSVDRSALVEILLDDGEDDAAWAEAATGGCRPNLWMRLAERREKKHPLDALRVYQQQLGPTIGRGGQPAYEEAFELLTRIKAIFERLGRGADFAPYRAAVRAAHRQKRNFLKLLDAYGG